MCEYIKFLLNGGEDLIISTFQIMTYQVVLSKLAHMHYISLHYSLIILSLHNIMVQVLFINIFER